MYKYLYKGRKKNGKTSQKKNILRHFWVKCDEKDLIFVNKSNNQSQIFFICKIFNNSIDKKM